MKRKHSIMLRLSDEEFDSVSRAKPDGEELASFARASLVGCVASRDPHGALRLAASFIVACLSPDITFEEACNLFDDHVTEPRKEVANGRGH
jgi:hypothetical protein